MSPSLRRRVRIERFRRDSYYTLLGWYRSITFPIHSPRFFLMGKYASAFFSLYYGGQEELALRWGRIWPSSYRMVIALLQEKRHRLPVLLA